MCITECIPNYSSPGLGSFGQAWHLLSFLHGIDSALVICFSSSKIVQISPHTGACPCKENATCTSVKREYIYDASCLRLTAFKIQAKTQPMPSGCRSPKGPAEYTLYNLPSTGHTQATSRPSTQTRAQPSHVAQEQGATLHFTAQRQ